MKLAVRILVLIGLLAAGANMAAAGWNGPRNLPESGHLHKAAMIAVPQGSRKTVPNFVMADQNGLKRDIASMRGRVLLVNFWATWCAPCVKEMPTLDAVQRILGGRDFEVLAVSQDVGGADVVKKFYARQNITSLKVLTDPDSAAFRALGLRGLPTTLVVDRRGRVALFFEGPTDWDSPQVVELIKSVIAES